MALDFAWDAPCRVIIVHNRFLLSLAHAVGHPLETFGNPALCKGGPLNLAKIDFEILTLLFFFLAFLIHAENENSGWVSLFDGKTTKDGKLQLKLKSLKL